QNEFGKIGIDGSILQRQGIPIKEIIRGSIFCSCLQLSFVEALAELAKSDAEYLFVESSGLADPSNIRDILKSVEVLAGDVYDFQGVICLIDGVHFPKQVKDTETVDRQLKHCDVAIINKIDLISEEQYKKVFSLVREVNPHCQVLSCAHGQADLSFMKEAFLQGDWAFSEESLNRVDNKPKTISLFCSENVEKGKFQQFLQAVLPECYRIKGFFLLDRSWTQVDVVEELIDYKPCPTKEISELVFLSKVGPKVIRSIDEAWKKYMDSPMKLKN
ncbi:MAG: GTP-binding protein, partial [Lachnospiraceae bacterium]|nr:GTP-binding protein [Lachnospiraceae bacterium]